MSEEPKFSQAKEMSFDLFESGMVRLYITILNQENGKPEMLRLAVTAEQADKYGKMLRDAAALT